MTAGGGNQLISVHPDELKFIFELEKQSYCDLKVVNNTEQHVAFKVKTTSPKKYFVRPNTGVIQPWDSCVIRVTLQAQREYPADMQCKDKFLLQSTTILPHTDVDELPPDTFNKDSSGKTLEECKLRVVYVNPSTQENSEEEASKSSSQSPDANSFHSSICCIFLLSYVLDLGLRERSFHHQALQLLKDERDAAVRQTHQLQKELSMMKRRGYRKSAPGFSLTFAFVVGLIGILVGFILNLTLPSSSTE
ncbi:vesicle-associated protein 2-1 isoform X1 [Hevea brasiliensis]|uniref:vesicle-associated protein 2-1 isoform X1 n=1 Tax=Hevea brasiliensis TaxID=3981 RepID=UPI000B77B10C|nr:vesicle-associated protein 2-1 isoform X1 [Hevea brasiliensis]XP_021639140.1 vesicle-associated protein 2-1 isoform X1 [Hevea brasiliensis]